MRNPENHNPGNAGAPPATRLLNPENRKDTTNTKPHEEDSKKIKMWHSRPRLCCCARFVHSRGLTLIELLIVLAIIAILALLAVVNFRQAIERTLKSADAVNLRTIGAALQAYTVDHGEFPPADREAGPFESHGPEFTGVGNGPAAGGSWDGIPWLLYEQQYIARWETMFCPKFLRLYSGVETIGGGHERYHNFRYAYNSSASSSGGPLGGAGDIRSGTVWMVRDLWVPPDAGWYAQDYPEYPADYRFPWGEGEFEAMMELVLYSDMAVKLKLGGEP